MKIDRLTASVVCSLMLRLVPAAVAAEKEHSICVTHPAQEDLAELPCTLIQVRDAQGAPVAYRMDVASVICGDGQCSIITVTLHWDALGNYDRYELPPRRHLTKKGHKRFTPEDYEQLHEILADRASILKQLERQHVSTPGKAAQDVDDVTGATPVSLSKAIVPGAVYTCYTLWHWVHGDVVREMKDLTARATTRKHLMRFLSDGSEALSIFAMDQFAERGVRDQAVADAVVERALANNATVAKAALRYLESTATEKEADIRYRAIEKLAPAADRRTRTLFLTALSRTPQPPPTGYYDRISKWLPTMQTYFEVHLLLELLEERSPESQEAVRQAMRVLENPNFLIARRAYWFLENKALADDQQQQVTAFGTKHEDRL